MGVTYSESNALGTGLKEPGDGGLTAFGRRAVRRMNEIGMANFAYVKNLVGIDHVAFGPDTLYGDHDGHPDEDIAKVLGENVLRVLEDVWQ